MGRYAGQKRRATTSETYAMDSDYNKVLTKAKRLHRSDGEFYIGNINGYYSSISILDVKTFNYNQEELEHWIFNNKRWIKQ